MHYQNLTLLSAKVKKSERQNVSAAVSWGLVTGTRKTADTPCVVLSLSPLPAPTAVCRSRSYLAPSDAGPGRLGRGELETDRVK